MTSRNAPGFSKDIYTEPQTVDVHTLDNLGPLRQMAGVWTGAQGLDVKPKVDGAHKQAYVEHYELQPIDPQTNGPQLIYGLRYHLLITKPEQIKTYHEQVGYWLWEPATETVTLTLTIPRAVTVMAVGKVAPDAKQFELTAHIDNADQGICSSAFSNHAFRTEAFTIKVTLHDDGSWAYEEDTMLRIRGQADLFHHTDRNLLKKIAEPTPNPLTRSATA